MFIKATLATPDAPYWDSLTAIWSIYRPIAPKRWVIEKKRIGVACQNARELPVDAIATAHWLTTRPVGLVSRTLPVRQFLHKQERPPIAGLRAFKTLCLLSWNA